VPSRVLAISTIPIQTFYLHSSSIVVRVSALRGAPISTDWSDYGAYPSNRCPSLHGDAGRAANFLAIPIQSPRELPTRSKWRRAGLRKRQE